MSHQITVAGVTTAVITHQDRRVCTTQQLAEFYGADAERIHDNFRKNADRFDEGKHFFKLDGEALSGFRDLLPENFRSQISPMVRALVLWTEKGAARHAKMLTTERAWEVFEQLEDAYFRVNGSSSVQPGQIAVPQNLPEALRLAADLAEQKAQAEAALADAAPKVEFVNRYVQAPGSMGFRQVAKLLRAKEPELRSFLLDSKIMYRLGGSLAPYSAHMDAGRFEVKTGESGANGHAFAQPKFTAKGVNWIAGLWAQHQLQPLLPQ